MASSANIVNFGVRQNKAIERSIIFGDLRKIARTMDLSQATYLGLGSVWFVDFEHAHRELGIESMISIEGDEVMHKRALFNRPYRTVEVLPGMSYDQTPELLKRQDLLDRPWIAWLDYDRELEDVTLEELLSLVKRMPDDSVIMTTINAHPGSYGSTRQERFQKLEELFGDSFQRESHLDGKGLVKTKAFQRVLAETLLRRLASEVAQARRVGGFVPAFNLHYQDGSPMVTVGGVLPSGNVANAVQNLTSSSAWRCMPDASLDGPPLTGREVASLRSLLPAHSPITRADVRKLGFDLLDAQIASFADYYLDYPLYVQAWR